MTAGTCVGGYPLMQVPDEANGKTIFYYRLRQTLAPQ
jgi:hypothetical protein